MSELDMYSQQPFRCKRSCIDRPRITCSSRLGNKHRAPFVLRGVLEYPLGLSGFLLCLRCSSRSSLAGKASGVLISFSCVASSKASPIGCWAAFYGPSAGFFRLLMRSFRCVHAFRSWSAGSHDAQRAYESIPEGLDGPLVATAQTSLLNASPVRPPCSRPPGP